jgi:hypothetical protein
MLGSVADVVADVGVADENKFYEDNNVNFHLHSKEHVLKSENVYEDKNVKTVKVLGLGGFELLIVHFIR